METQAKNQPETTRMHLKTLGRVFEGFVDRTVDRSQPVSAWSEEMLIMVKQSTAKGLWNAARQLHRAARKLDEAGYHLAMPVTSGKTGSMDLIGPDDEVIAPHLA